MECPVEKQRLDCLEDRLVSALQWVPGALGLALETWEVNC